MNNKLTVCETNKCTGCGACVDACAKDAITIVDSVTSYNAVIDSEKCINCGRCHKICQNNQMIEYTQPKRWVQGWITDEELRKKSSSGGAAAALTRGFISHGGTVCSCTFHDGKFCFEFADKIEDAGKFAGSKYVKSNPQGIYKQVLEKLRQGEKILFIGLPCQVSALKIFVGKQYQENLYTVDLICHGTPSPKLLNQFLKQYHYDLDSIRDISFRYKDVFGVKKDFHSIVQPGAVDPYLLAFLCALDYTDNCYSCKYAGTKRIGDLTIGDSWGSDLSEEEQEKGISLILCQSEKGEELLRDANMKVFPVDKEKAISKQHQLQEPEQKNNKSDVFFQKCLNGKFNNAVFNSLPKKFVKQKIKAVLLKCKIVRGMKSQYTVLVKE